MQILGLSAYYHDSAACLVRDGEILAAAQEERFTRKKHDESFPKHSVRYCLEQAKTDISQVDLVVFYEKPFLKFERLLETYLAYAPAGLGSFLKAMPVWLREKLWLKSAIADDLKYSGTIIFPEHHESHAASAFFPSPFEESAVLTMDGVGEWATSSIGHGKGNRVKLLKELRFPHSLGLLYSAFTYYTGFKVNSGEYKVMGLAPYGAPRYKDLILTKLMDLKDDGSFRLNMEYFNYCAGLTMTSGRFHKLFGGPPRRLESRLGPREMDLAASVQAATEEVMLRMARYAARVTGSKNLCLAGGVSLNCVGNGKILREGIFENIWIQPAAGDAGGALGSALLGYHHYFGKERKVPANGRDHMKGSFLGPDFDDASIEAYLRKHSIPYQKLGEDALCEKVAALMAEEKVVGWFSGRMEFGPRALGARSIIGDARSPKMQEVMNVKIKFRESFRPFAPAVAEENAADYFELRHKSPYMLIVAPVQEKIRRRMTAEEEALFGIEKLNVTRSTLPAVTHVDYSARVQTVSRDENPVFYKLIRKFGEKNGAPVIINTSFNVRGEPMVCRPEEAYKCFMRTQMDALVLGSFLLEKADQKPLEKDEDWKKEFQLD